MTMIDHPYEAQIPGSIFYIPDDVLLNARVCDLGLNIENTPYPQQSKKLLSELKRVGLSHIKPKFYLADEWFCPSGSASIAIPYWLTHPRLRRLEKSMIGYVEGSTPKDFMKLLRHEMGHCFEHAYKLSKRSDWKAVFGNPSAPYDTDNYVWNPKSKDYVIHLPDGYAQSHPEEDFAETFAVWLDPQSKWKSVYKNWQGALKKLHFVGRLVSECALVKPKKISYKTTANAARSKKTLRDLYRPRTKMLNS
jgi:hypothetical protein